MKQIIQKYLNQIEETQNVKIVYACESGSRAWGFASLDSDYDVRFIYVKEPWQYITVFPDNRTMDRLNVKEFKLIEKDTNVDMVGWDIKKAVYLMGGKGNPDIISWLNSPIIYRTSRQTKTLKQIAKEFFRKKTAIYHYLHMARGNFNQYINGKDMVIRKKYLYVLRPLLACQHIERHETAPPMLFQEMFDMVPKTCMGSILKLLQDKKSQIEMGKCPNNRILSNYCERLITRFEALAEKMDVKTKTDQEWEELNNYLRLIIKNTWKESYIADFIRAHTI